MLFKGNILDLTAFTDKSRRLQNFRKLGANNPYNDGLSGFSTTTSWTINDAIEVTNIGGSVYFDGTNSSLSIPGGSWFNPNNTSQWTMEGWFYDLGSTNQFAFYYGTWGSIANFGVSIGDTVSFQSGNGSWSWVTNTTLVANTGSPKGWSHFAFVKNGSTFEVFLNGTRIYTGTPTFGTGGTTGTAWIGTYFNQSPYFNRGYLSNFRITTGTALYTSNFTPPAEPLKRISGTSLLTCQGSAITDASLNNFTITANGNAAATSSVGPFGYYAVGISTGLYRTFNNVDNLELRNVPLVGSSNITLVDKKNNRYFAGTNNGFLYSSTDGETWTDVSGGLRTNTLINWGNTNNTSRIWSIEYGQGYYVVSGINRLAYSTDLSTWSDARIGRDFYGNVGLTSRSRNNSFVDWQSDDYNYKIYYHPQTSKWYIATLGNIGFTTNIADPGSWRQVANSDFYNIFNEYPEQLQSNLTGWSYQYGSQAGIALSDRIVAMKGWGGYTNGYHTPVAFSTSTTFSETSGLGMRWSEFKTPSFGPVGIKTIFAGYTPNHISQGPNNQKIITAAYTSNSRISRVAITTDFVSYTNLGHGGAARNVGFGYTSAMVSGSQDANTATFQKPDMAVLYTSYMRGGNNNYYDYYSAYSSAYKSGNNKWVIAYDWGGVGSYTHNSVAISTDGGTSWKGALHETENSIYNNYTTHVYSGVGSTDYFILGKYNSTDGAYVEVSQDGEEWYSTGIGDTTSQLVKENAQYLISGIQTGGYYLSGYSNGKLFASINPASRLDRETIPVNPNNSLEPDNLVLCLPLNTARGVNDISGIMTSYTGTNKTVTNNNGVGIATTVSKYYGSSASFDGTDDYLSIADQNDLNLGTGDFTMEFWVYANSLSDFDGIIGKRSDSNFLSNSWRIAYSSSQSNINLAHTGNNSASVSYAPAPTLNTWTHYAFVRESGNVRAYKDGVKYTDVSYTYDFSNTYSLLIGANANATYTWHGHLQDLRVYKGYAKYTANFTPPRLADYFQYLTFSAPLNTENPSVSLTYVNTFELSAGIGTTATTLTNTAVSIATNATNSIGVATYLHGTNAGIGSTVIVTSLYTNAGATTIGIATYKFGTSSVRFPGASNSLLTGSRVAFGTTDFTISFFFNAQGTGQNNINTPFEQTDAGLTILSSGNGPMSFSAAGATRISGTTNMSVGTWHHICVQRNSGVTRLFVNGTQEGSSYTDTNNYPRASINLGQLALLNYYNMNAYLDDLVVWNGVANYAIGVGNTIQVPQSQYNINTDPNRNYVVMSSTFEDTPVGTTNISYTGLAERGIALFNGTTSAITGTATTAFYFGTGDYTIECFYYKNATDSSGNEYLFDGRVDNNTRIRPTLPSIEAYGGPLGFYLNGAYRIYGQNLGGSVNSSSAALGITTSPAVDLQGRSNLNKWNHVALCRKDSITRLYINGKIQGVYADTNSYDGPGMRIGNYWNGSNAFNGYIQDFQVYKGYAKYYPSGTSDWTEILTTNATAGRELNYTLSVKGIQNKLVDGKSVYAIAVGSKVGIATDALFTNVGVADTVNIDYFVNNGVVGVATTSARGTGSASFNGSSYLRYIGQDASFKTNNFTIEFWVRFNSAPGTTILFDSRTSTGTNEVAPTIYTSANVLYYYVSGANRITGSTLSANIWYHIAVSRVSGTTRMFVNGTQVGSNYTDSNNYLNYLVNGKRISIGADASGSNPLTGQMNSVRVYNGYGAYTTTFTPPAAPLTTSGDANVSSLVILSNFNTTGSLGIDTTAIPHIPYEYYGKKRLNSLGISTTGITTTTLKWQQPINTSSATYSRVGLGTTSKYGGVVAYFDGNDYLRYSDPRNSSYVFGSNDYSIEFWVNPSTLSGTQTIYDGRPGVTGPYPYVYTSGTSLIYNANNSNVLSGILTTNSWQHVLIQRKSGTANMFIGGVQQGGSYSDTNFYRENGIGPNYRYLGSNYSQTERFVGHLQDFRIYNGVAPYTQSVGLTTGPLSESAALSTTQVKYQATSLSVSGDSITKATTGSLLPPLGGDFCIEFWGYYVSGQTFFEYGVYNNGFLFRSDSWYISALSAVTSGSFAGQYLSSQWAHYALIRSGNTVHYYRDGVGLGTGTCSGTLPSAATDIRFGSSRHTSSNGLSGYISDFIIYNGTSKYTVGAGITFQPPTAAYDINTDSLNQYVAFAATFGGTNGQTSMKFDKAFLQVTAPTTSLTAVGDTNFKNLAILSNLNTPDLTYQTYAPKDPIDDVITLPEVVSSLTQLHVFDNKFVAIGDYGYVAVSTNAYNWSVGSRRGRPGSGNVYTTNVGIRSYYLANSTYFYDIVGVGSTVVVTGEYSAPSYLHTFFSNNGGEDEFANLWHGSSLELYQQGLSGSPTIPWTGGTSIGFSTTTNELLLANSYGTYRNYGDSAINYASGIPTTGINTNTHNWVDFTLNVRSLVERSGKITKVKNADNKWYIIGYDATANNSQYQLGITTSLSSINDSMKLVRVGYKQFTDVASAGGDNFVAISSQFPQRNSLANDIITISGIKTSYTTTQTQNQYFSDPSITGTGATDRVVTGLSSVSGAYGSRSVPTASTAAFKYGTKSWYFTNNAAFTDSQLDFNFNTGDFQIEFWFNPQSSGGGTYIIMPIDQNYAIQYSSTSLNWIGSGGTRTIQTGITTNAWYHVAVARQGGVTRTFWNGTQTGSYSDVIDYRSNSTYGRTFGARGDGYSPGASNYYLDDIRIYTGYCGYTTNFTAPTSQLTIAGSTRPEKISFFSNCEDDNYTKMVDSYYVTGRDYVTNLNNYYPRLTNASTGNYTWNTTVEGYFKPDVAGIHTFSLYSLYNTVLSFDGKAVTSTNYNTTRLYTTPSLSTSTYYPIKIVTDEIGYSYTLQFTYQNSANSTFTGDFSRTGFATAGVGTVGFNVFDVPYFSNNDTTFVGYRHKGIRGVLKGDNSYVYFGDRGFVGYSTDNINIRNFRREGYRGLDFNPVGIGKSINDIFGTNLINCGIYTSGYYALGGNSNPPKLAISTNGLDWNNKSTFVSDVLSGNTATTFNALGITSSNKVILSMGTNSVAITTDFVTVSASVYNPGVAATSLFTNGGAVGAAISTGVSKWGNGSLWIKPNANTSSYVEASFTNIVSGDYTMEWWQRQTGTQYGYYGTMEWGVYSNSILNTGSGGWYLSGGSGGVSGSGAGWSNTANTWEHYALVRNGSTVTMYKDGVGTVLTTNGSGTFDPTTDTFRIGAPQWAGGNWAGNMNDYVFYNGFAKYTSNFTPPSAQYDITTDPYSSYVMFAAPFTGTVDGATGIIYYTGIVGTAKTAFAGITTTITAVGGIGTVNVLGDSNGKLYITDDTLSGITSVGFSTIRISSTAYGQVVSGTTQVGVASVKFGTGSVRFSGVSNSRLSGPRVAFGTTDFTIEFWFNAAGTGQNGYNPPFDCRPSGTQGLYPLIYSLSNGPMRYFVNSADRITGTTNMTTGVWRHICIQRSSGTTKLFVNGTQEGSTYTDTNNYLSSVIQLGDLYLSNSYNMNAYLDDLVVYSGVAKYNHTSFTAPTSAYNIETDTYKDYVVLSSNFDVADGLIYKVNDKHPSYFGGNPVKKFIKTDQYLIGIATGGYVGYSTNGTSWSVTNGFNGNVTGVAYNGISTDPKYTIVNENGEIYMSGIN